MEQINALTGRGSNYISNCTFDISQPTFHHTKNVKLIRNLFHLTSVTESELFNIIHSLASKSSSGFDDVSIKNLKLIYPYIAAVLLQIIIKSVESCVFPEFLKIACHCYTQGR